MHKTHEVNQIQQAKRLAQPFIPAEPAGSNPRIDTSGHVWFANDQLAVRFIEEIDFDYAATDATAALITAAS